jgi:two-component system chemotaxis response regulator CheB
VSDACRVVLVDDSSVIRGMVTRWLEQEPGIAVVGSAPNGAAALSLVARVDPDVVVLDIEMPEMDGLTALPKLLAVNREIKVVMASTLTLRNADISLQALRLGAADYVAKPESARDPRAAENFRRELIEKIRVLGAPRAARRAPNHTRVAARPLPGPAKPAKIVLRPPSRMPPKALAIGSSTGGPQALFQLFQLLKGQIRQPVFITQHMPATFTTILAEHLTRIGGAPCHEAKDGEPVRDGRIYLAPGDYHMTVATEGGARVIRLNQNPPENFCRPAVDPMLRSLAEAYGGQLLAVILTGMGQDGLKGGRALIDAGGTLVAQDEASSVVWGMPGAVATAGLCAAVLPLNDVGPTVMRFMSGAGL